MLTYMPGAHRLLVTHFREVSRYTYLEHNGHLKCFSDIRNILSIHGCSMLVTHLEQFCALHVPQMNDECLAFHASTLCWRYFVLRAIVFRSVIRVSDCFHDTTLRASRAAGRFASIAVRGAQPQ